jgi:hypothetical protein
LITVDGTDKEDISINLQRKVSDLLDSGMHFQRTFWKLSFFPAQSIGVKTFNLSAEISKEEGLHKIVAPVIWSIDSDFSVSPLRIIVNQSGYDIRERLDKIVIKQNNTVPFVIESVKTSFPESTIVSIDYENIPADEHTITLVTNFSEYIDDSYYAHNIEVEIRCNDQPSVLISPFLLSK